MISGIQIALKNAIDVIAPPATPLQDFTYHWKQLMNFYVNHLTDCKVPIQTTGIPRHLDRLLALLLEEEKEDSDPGPCLEYLLQHKLLDLLATLASAETPPGMRIVCLSFLKKLLGRSKYPLLHHASIYGPVQRLIALCNGNPPSPIEAEEIQFLLTLCFLVCKYPHVTNMINDVPNVQRQNLTHGKNSEQMQVQKVTYIPARRRNNSNPLFEPLDTQAVTLINPNLFGTDSDRRRSICSNRSFTKTSIPRGLSTQSNGSVSSRDVESISQSSSPAIEKPICHSTSSTAISTCDTHDYQTLQKPYKEECPINEIDAHLQNLRDLRLDTESSSIYDDVSNMLLENESNNFLRPHLQQKSKCLLLDALLSYLNSADNTVRIRACEGIMVLASLEDTSFVQMIVKSELTSVISNRLENLFNAIPAHVDPNDIDSVDVTWGLDSPLWTKDKKFSGCRQIAAFFMWFDYCNQLIREAHQDLAETLAKSIRIMFFEKIITPALADHHVVLITALVTKCLKELTSTVLCTEVSYWLVGQDRDPEISNMWNSPVLHRLIENCFTDSDDLILETLKLFEEIIEKRNEHILHCLILIYLSKRGYYDNTAADSAIASWSDEEDEREREKKGSLDLSYEQSHSRTLAPSNIHRIINCFLSLVPRYLQTDSDINNYERYMAHWERQYATVLTDCSLMAWPLEAVTVDDCASSDSRPEADHCTVRFYMGPFLTMLFEKVSNIPKQKYEINLQLTSVISRIALLPHPYLHEFLLNPLLPLAPDTKSLFTCLQKVIKQLVNEVPKTPEHKQLLKETRERLMEECSHDAEKENILLESVIVTEEFWSLINNITLLLTGNILEGSPVVKVNTENLSANGELYFLLSLKAWKAHFKGKNECDKQCSTILQHFLHIKGINIDGKADENIAKEVFEFLVLASNNWLTKIEKCTLQNERISLFLNRPELTKHAIRIAIESGCNFGKSVPADEVFNLKILPDLESELTTARLQLIQSVTEKLLDLHGYQISDIDNAKKFIFTTKSQGNIEKNYEKYVCGVVKNAATNTKEISLTWDDYIKNKVKVLTELNGHKDLGNEFLNDAAKATATFELLTVKPSRPVFIGINTNAERSMISTKGACFVLYNTARIIAIISKYYNRQSSGEYPSMPNIEDVDFSQLMEEEEWELVYNFVLGYPQMIKDCIRHDTNFRINPQCVCLFLLRLCQKFSIYYRKIRILTLARDHLLPKMIARLYMLQALQIILQNALEIMNIQPLAQM
ncbi:hypothetical protein KM043_006382 [Ampulex compressa]|nr:hypothetical protein KM043_006382 [Ampulex compressa]